MKLPPPPRLSIVVRLMKFFYGFPIYLWLRCRGFFCHGTWVGLLCRSRLPDPLPRSYEVCPKINNSRLCRFKTKTFRSKVFFYFIVLLCVLLVGHKSLWGGRGWTNHSGEGGGGQITLGREGLDKRQNRIRKGYNKIHKRGVLVCRKGTYRPKFKYFIRTLKGWSAVPPSTFFLNLMNVFPFSSHTLPLTRSSSPPCKVEKFIFCVVFFRP